MRLSGTISSLLTATLLALTMPALAQAPRVSSVYPPVVRRGDGGTVTLTGENLKAGSRVLVSGEGVTATVAPEGGGTSLTVRVAVAADALSGVRELRLLGPNGASNAARVAVGTLPELSETEPNNKPEEAQALKELPATVYGRIEALGDTDVFRFHAAAGETWVFELGSDSHGSSLDGLLSLRDASGHELVTVVKTQAQDPRLVHTFEATGDYTIAVRDVTYRGGPEATYRLSLGQLPMVTRALPLAVARGQTTTVQLAGYNLGGMATMAVSVPADYAGSTMTVVPKTPAGEAAPMTLAVSSMPELMETEPNDDRTHATRLETLPAAVSGVIGRDGDTDFYQLHAAAGQKLTLDLFARRLGTRLDSFIRVMDAAGKELASNDDAVGKDSRLAWSPPAAGDYTVQVMDIAGQGGDDRGYRLEVTTTPAPDFKLTVTPDVVNIPRGSAEVLTIRAERLNEFAGDIAVRVEGLPAGVTASPLTLSKGRDAEQITLIAAPDVSVDGFPLRVIGTATAAGQPVERAAQPMESVQLPGRDDRRDRPTTFQVAGLREAIPYQVTVEPQQVTLAPGGTAKLTVKLTRPKEGEAAKAVIGLFVLNLPEGVNQEIPDIPADKSEGTIELKATDKVEARETHLIVRTRIKEDFRYVPAIPLTLVAKAPEAAKPEPAK